MWKYAGRSCFVVAVAWCLVACQEYQGRESIPSTPPPAPADRSLTLDNYFSLGLPSCEHAWSRLELADAAKVMEAVAEDDLAKLPRCDSSRSSDVFKRFISDDCFAELVETRVPVEERLSGLVEIIGANRSIWRSYHEAFKRNVVGGAEIVALSGVQLRQAAVTVMLLDEFLPTLDPTDPKYETRIEGLRKMRQGLAFMIQGALVMVAEAHLYSLDERKQLISYLLIAMPTVLPAIDEGRAQQLRTQLDDMIVDSALVTLRPELRALQRANLSAGRANHAMPSS